MPPPAAEKWERLNREVPEVWGQKEVAEALGIKPTNLPRQAGVPPHIPGTEKLARGRLWRADVIREFRKARARARAKR